MKEKEKGNQGTERGEIPFLSSSSTTTTYYHIVYFVSIYRLHTVIPFTEFAAHSLRVTSVSYFRSKSITHPISFPFFPYMVSRERQSSWNRRGKKFPSANLESRWSRHVAECCIPLITQTVFSRPMLKHARGRGMRIPRFFPPFRTWDTKIGKRKAGGGITNRERFERRMAMVPSWQVMRD